MDESKMTIDDIIRMAREAGFAQGVAELLGLKKFARFAALVAAAESEACAQVCEEYENDMGYGQPQKCADAIRARNQK